MFTILASALAGDVCTDVEGHAGMTMTKDRPADQTMAARRAMIDSQLKPSGVNEPWVLTAMANVAREDFVPESMRDAAYIDRAIPLADGRALAPPVVHALMLAEAEPSKNDKVLLVGDGDGYLAALLRPLAGTLDAVSPDAAIKKRGRGTYSLVIVDGAIEDLPKALGSQLAEGARIVTGIIENGVTRLATGRKIAGDVSLLPVADIGIPELPEFKTPKQWSF